MEKSLVLFIYFLFRLISNNNRKKQNGECKIFINGMQSNSSRMQSKGNLTLIESTHFSSHLRLVIIIFITFLRQTTPLSCQISKHFMWYFSILYLRWEKESRKIALVILVELWLCKKKFIEGQLLVSWVLLLSFFLFT